MSNLRDLKNETTLSALASQSQENTSSLCWGVIIDISEPTKTEKGANFTTKLKIIDPSFHYKSQQKDNALLKFHKYATINIYSETPETCPKINYVGDIIRLRRFKFKLTDSGELMGTMTKYSNWLIYDGEPNSKEMVSTCFKPLCKNNNRTLSSAESGRLVDLRKWNDNYFFQNSLKFITWWTGLKQESQGEKCDLVLLCNKIDNKNKTLYFVDEDKRNYLLALPQKPMNLLDQVIKLRCVNVSKHGQIFHISLTALSSCLKIREWFYDARHLRKCLGGDKV